MEKTTVEWDISRQFESFEIYKDLCWKPLDRDWGKS